MNKRREVMILKDVETGKVYSLQELKDNGDQYWAELTRLNDNGIQTTGELVVYKGADEVFSCKTLELTWADNAVNVSCIPKGRYEVTPYSSAKYPDTYEVLQVKGRSNILIHWGNYYTNTEGCILVGKEFTDINGDGEIDVTSSRDTVQALRDATEYNDFKLYIL